MASESEFTVRLKADGLRASLMQRVVPVEDELKRFVAKYVTREIRRDDIRAARTIDVADKINGAWQAPGQSQVAEDLNEELEREMGASFLMEDGPA